MYYCVNVSFLFFVIWLRIFITFFSNNQLHSLYVVMWIRIIREVNEECGQTETSSDDDDEEVGSFPSRGAKPSYISLRYQSHGAVHGAQRSPEDPSGVSVVDTFSQRTMKQISGANSLPGNSTVYLL